MKRWIWPAAAAAAAVGLAGCGSATNTGAASGSTTSTSATTAPASSTGTTGASGTTATSATSGTSGTSGTTSSTSGTTSTTAVSGVAECTTSQLSGTLTDANGAAGSVYYHLVLTNKGSGTCFVQGYPGVSFVTTPEGAPVGAAAKRQADPSVSGTPRVTLTSGSSAHSILRIVAAGNFPASSCGPTKVPGLRVYPPDQKASLYVTSQQEACSNASTNVLFVEPLVPGS
ncbi:DUF4232 domain-containing protein [Acidimicrobiaceae bacterium USS-CC1]|uniref:DUF4232 domain-containing protein n=1 Tax=Acidiferrimicrobium australe TaxID=2664430 RepID=A0ABW9QSX2_9ACTN|nr:DUF4232 domain-containing protein [Acidiferrimicrobium australe]